MKTQLIFKNRKLDFYDANGAKAEVLTQLRFDLAAQELAMRFHEWMLEEGWKFLRVSDKEAAYVNGHLHEIYIHGSEYHFRKLITEHGKSLDELFTEFNCEKTELVGHANETTTKK